MCKRHSKFFLPRAIAFFTSPLNKKGYTLPVPPSFPCPAEGYDSDERDQFAECRGACTMMYLANLCLLLSPLSSATAGIAAPVTAPAAAAAISEDQVWLISTRGAGCASGDVRLR